jgi:hypothetical protein
VTAQTGNYTFVLGDANTWVRYNSSSAGTFTVPLNSSVAFPIGTVIIMDQTSSGALTVAATGGVTLDNATPGLLTRAQDSVIAITKLGTDEWMVTGDTQT